MKTKLIIALFAATALVGCGNSNNGNNNDQGVGDGDGGVGPDLAPPSDMVDTTPIPAPTVKHVGATGNSAGLVTAGANVAAYLLNPTGATTVTGALHVVTKDGTDKAIDTAVPMGGYGLGADGKSVLYTKASGQNASLLWADPTAATPTPKTIFNGTVASTTLGQIGFFSPSGHYFVVGVKIPNVAQSQDMHIVDAHTGTDVYSRPNGSFDYLELVLPDDTLIFQDTAGGTSTGTTPVQTLYWLPLPMAATATATAITTHTSQFSPTADNKTLLILKTSGDLLTWDLTARTGAGTKIASSVVKYATGFDPTIVAYLDASGGAHVVKTDGTAVFDLAAAKATAADLTGPLVLAPDGGDLYYFQNVETQSNRGTLMRVQTSNGATPSKVGDKISTRDVNVMDNALVLEQNVDDLGQFGDVVTAKRDGSGVTPLGMKAPVGGVQAVNPGPDTWFVMHLANAAIDMTNTPIDGSAPITGKLMWADYLGMAELQLDATAHQGAFGFSDDGRDAVYVAGVAWNAAAKNFAGKLTFLATRAPSMAIDGMLTGVTELGPVVGRSLFVNAPQAATAGVYFVTY